MSFAAPYELLWLLLVPAAVAGYLWLERRREGRAARWGTPALVDNLVARPATWRRHAPTALLLAGLALLLVGFARPKASLTVPRREATVVVVLDVSGSMAASDEPPSRLAAARAAAERLLAALPHGAQLSVVTFSDHVAVVAPPTDDPARVRGALDRAHSGPQGTALADAVARAVAVVRSTGPAGKRPPAAIVLLSDGGQTAGRLTPQAAAEQARQAGVPVVAVADGTPGGVVLQALKGGYTERIEVPVEPAVLRTIAQTSGGELLPGPDALDPKRLYAALGSRAGHRRKVVEVTSAAAAGGLAFMLAGALLSGVWFRRLP